MGRRVNKLIISGVKSFDADIKLGNGEPQAPLPFQVILRSPDNTLTKVTTTPVSLTKFVSPINHDEREFIYST